MLLYSTCLSLFMVSPIRLALDDRLSFSSDCLVGVEENLVNLLDQIKTCFIVHRLDFDTTLYVHA